MFSRNSFTLIELLVVIAILAVLATAVVLVLNPAELVKASRDATRLADLQSINKGLGLLQADIPSLNLGNATTVSISIPDSSPTCANLGLPTLPTGYGYRCVTATNLRRVDGTGWIPVDFTQFSSGAILATLPIDPINTTSSGNYYTYIPGGSWHLATSLEAAKNKMGGSADKVSTDKGKFPSLYEVGSNLTLLPLEYSDTSLVGYWPLDEGTGTVVYDASGNNATGTWSGTWTTGNVGSGAISCSGSNYVTFPYNALYDFGNRDFTVIAWINPTSAQSRDVVSNRVSDTAASKGFSLFTVTTGNGYSFCRLADGTINPSAGYYAPQSMWGTWSQIALTANRTQKLLTPFLNGAAGTPTNISTLNDISVGNGIKFCTGAKGAFTGSIDEVRIYNRALSAAEISALYNAAK